MIEGRRESRVAALRRFNRFYTRQIGLLRRTFLDSAYSLGEARVLHEIAEGPARTASEVGRVLGLDAGYLSRLLRAFEKRRLIVRQPAAADARQRRLALTPQGRRIFAALERRSQRDAAAMLHRLTRPDQARLIGAMRTIGSLLGDAAEPRQPKRRRAYTLRRPRPGDYGWIVKRHAELYAQDYRWTEPFEGVCARIVAGFANGHDPSRERCWIAEMDGENVGCVFLMTEATPVARIRLLLVEPRARGVGLGARLVAECVAFARKAGYRKITLWTHSVLTAARHVYKQAGFRLMRSEPHSDWGRPVIGEHWDLEL